MPGTVTFESQLDTIFQPQLLELWLHGIYTAIFFITIFAIYYRKRRKSSNRYVVIITTTMYSISTLSSAIFWYQNRRIFVWDAAKAAAMSEPIKELPPDPLWAFVCRNVTFSINTLLADCLLIWRCWVVWGQDWRVIIPPAILTVVGTVFSVLADIAQIDSEIADLNRQNVSSLINSKFFTTTGTVYLALSFGTTLVVTILITYRILSINHFNNAIINVSTTPGERSESTLPKLTDVVEILVESSMLYAFSIFALFVLIAIGDPSYLYALAVVTQVTGLAPTLILTRITLGFARPATTWTTTGAGVQSQMRFASVISRSQLDRTIDRTQQPEFKDESDGAAASTINFA